jgi:AraC family transcriptional regulator
MRRLEKYGYTGAVVEHRRLPGAHISRVMHPPGQRIEAHAHDWPVLTLFRVGGYHEAGEGGEIAFDGPSVVFQPAGAAHADEIGSAGLETLAMTFDPAWLGPDARAALPSRTCWRLGGPLCFAARDLGAVWLSSDTTEPALRMATFGFLVAMGSAWARIESPPWVDTIEGCLDDEMPMAVIARRVERHPAWVARAYRAWRGEGMGERVRRRRVERATLRLRMSEAPLADVAAECGFCDQSHMNRSFRAVLGRTPLEVRREAALLAGFGI